MANLPIDPATIPAGPDPPLAPKAISSPVSKPADLPNSTRYEFYSDPTFPNLEYCGVPITVLTYPTKLAYLTPHEEAGHFHSREHEQLYNIIKHALNRHLDDLKKFHLTEVLQEPSTSSSLEKQHADEFHQELSRRVGWITTPDQTAIPSLDRPASIAGQKQNSPFPSINNFIKNFPNISVAATVADFYLRQDERMAEHRRIMELRHNWETWECYFRFHRCAVMLRRACPADSRKHDHVGRRIGLFRLMFSRTENLLHYFIPDIDSYYEDNRSRHLGTAPSDMALREAQFAVLKKVRMALYEKSMSFPLRMCPGKRTIVEFFHPLQLPMTVPRTAEKAYDEWFKRPGWFPERESQKQQDDVLRVVSLMWKSPTLKEHYEKMDRGLYHVNDNAVAVMRPVSPSLMAEGKEEKEEPKPKKPEPKPEPKPKPVSDEPTVEPKSSQQLQSASSVNLVSPQKAKEETKDDTKPPAKQATPSASKDKSASRTPEKENAPVLLSANETTGTSVLNASTNEAAKSSSVEAPVHVEIPNAPVVNESPGDTAQANAEPNNAAETTKEPAQQADENPTKDAAAQTDTPTTPGETDKPQRPKMVKNGSHWSIRGEWPSGLRA